MADKTRSIFVVEGVRSVRDDLCQLVEESSHFRLAGRAGSLTEAIHKLGGTSAQVMLLDLDLYELEDLDFLKRFCESHPELQVIGTGREWNDMVLRPVLNAGVAGYLSKPFDEWELLRALQDPFREVDAAVAANENAGRTSGHVVLFVAPKRGCGLTTMAVNTAVELAGGEKVKVCLWDADLRFGDAAMMLNVVPKASVVDLARELEGLSIQGATSYFAMYSDMLWLLAPPMRPEQAELLSGQKLKEVLAFLKKSFNYVIIDAAAGLDANALALVSEADQVVLMSEVEGIAPEIHLATARAVVADAGVGAERQIVALNRIRTEDLADVNRFRVEGGKPLLFLFPNDYPSATASLNSGTPVVQSKPDSQLGRSVSQFAELLQQREKKFLTEKQMAR